MSKEINSIDLSQVVNDAMLIINEHFPECDAKKMVLQHLRILNGFEMNMYAITMAMMKIREEAQIEDSNKFNSDELLLSLKKIEIIADNMHNVGAFLAQGKACDAMSMLYTDSTCDRLWGGDKRPNLLDDLPATFQAAVEKVALAKSWPNGSPNITEHCSGKFCPISSSSIEECRDFILAFKEITKSEEYIEGFSLTLEEFMSLREKSELILWVESSFPYEGVIADIPPMVFEGKTFYPYLNGTRLPVSLRRE